MSGLICQLVVGHEIGREPFEEFGMRRRFALGAEVFRRADESLAEEVLPDAVDHHAGHEAGRARIFVASASGRRPARRPLSGPFEARFGERRPRARCRTARLRSRARLRGRAFRIGRA